MVGDNCIRIFLLHDRSADIACLQTLRDRLPHPFELDLAPAADLEQAIAAQAGQDVDAIIVGLPASPADDPGRVARVCALEPSAPVLALADAGMTEQVCRAIRAGAQDYYTLAEIYAHRLALIPYPPLPPSASNST